MILYEQSPWGEERADLRMGILGSAIVNCWIDKKSKKVKPKDFIPEFGSGSPERQSIDKQIEVAKAFAAIYGGGK